MKEFFARLNPVERRFVVGVAVAFFLVGNIVWVWPHFGDWAATRTSMDNWRATLDKFERGADKLPGLKTAIARYKNQGDTVPLAKEAVEFFRLIQNQAAASRVGIINMGGSRQTTGTNQFFVEQNQTITTQSGEKELVDFLYHLGAGQSLIRVKVLSVQPDQSHQQLTARITLVASYQKPAETAKAAPAPANAAPVANKPPTPTVPKAAAPAPPGTKPIPGANPLGPRPGPPSPPGRASPTNKLNFPKPNK